MTEDELKAMNEARDKCPWANQTNARNSFLHGFEAGLAHARALLAAGASEGQAGIEYDVAFRDMSPAECCSSCGLTFGESTLLHEIKTGQKQAIHSAEIAALRERIAGMEKDLESRIPDGWRFYTADFSGSRSPGSATLIRDDKGKAEWLALSDEEREATDLYVFGRGNTFREAIDAAIAAIAKEKQA